MLAIIGQGFIGTYLSQQLSAISLSREDTIPADVSTVIIAAPTGNRIWVNNNQDADFENCQDLVKKLNAHVNTNLILISTVDVFCDTTYGQNRRWLEYNIGASKILRLPMLCHSSIQKNFLYDLKHEQWLDKFNLKSTFQYYPLEDLIKDIDYATNSTQKFFNLTSPPLLTEFIVERYKPRLLNTMAKNSVPEIHYNVQTDTMQYHVSYNSIIDSMDKYFYN